ncbi:hypothetical protein Scep_008695 [Stephania cephalantha]|uniref:Uncharacterized protein n=1 Tax=Stephania cephalantha TaxID=152367 RepID=A0AAP0PDG8_9MAGN
MIPGRRGDRWLTEEKSSQRQARGGGPTGGEDCGGDKAKRCVVRAATREIRALRRRGLWQQRRAGSGGGARGPSAAAKGPAMARGAQATAAGGCTQRRPATVRRTASLGSGSGVTRSDGSEMGSGGGGSREGEAAATKRDGGGASLIDRSGGVLERGDGAAAAHVTSGGGGGGDDSNAVWWWRRVSGDVRRKWFCGSDDRNGFARTMRRKNEANTAQRLRRLAVDRDDGGGGEYDGDGGGGGFSATMRWQMEFAGTRRRAPGKSEESCSTQLIDGDGVFNVVGLESFSKTVKLGECGLSYAVRDLFATAATHEVVVVVAVAEIGLLRPWSL